MINETKLEQQIRQELEENILSLLTLPFNNDREIGAITIADKIKLHIDNAKALQSTEKIIKQSVITYVKDFNLLMGKYRKNLSTVQFRSLISFVINHVAPQFNGDSDDNERVTMADIPIILNDVAMKRFASKHSIKIPDAQTMRTSQTSMAKYFADSNRGLTNVAGKVNLFIILFIELAFRRAMEKRDKWDQDAEETTTNGESHSDSEQGHRNANGTVVYNGTTWIKHDDGSWSDLSDASATRRPTEEELTHISRIYRSVSENPTYVPPTGPGSGNRESIKVSGH